MLVNRKGGGVPELTFDLNLKDKEEKSMGNRGWREKREGERKPC